MTVESDEFRRSGASSWLNGKEAHCLWAFLLPLPRAKLLENLSCAWSSYVPQLVGFSFRCALCQIERVEETSRQLFGLSDVVKSKYSFRKVDNFGWSASEQERSCDPLSDL